LYKLLIRPLLFLLNPEKAHYFTFNALKICLKVPGMSTLFRFCYQINNKTLEKEVFGIKFPNPVGLGAGLDKDAILTDELGQLGFGFIEIGTLTPKPQPGNDKPRLFRLKKDQALINRMGFNNKGVESAVSRLKNRKSKIIIGGNIGKNKITTNEDAINDYEICFEALFDHVDYFAVNVSSPNTPGLRALQEKEPLKALLSHLKSKNAVKPKPKPILLKIAPDLSNEQLDDIIEIVKEVKLDGVIATNTTTSREGLLTDKSIVEQAGMGGLSGKPIARRSTEVIRYLHTKSGGAFPIIGIGGIHSEEDALEKLAAGASLIQLYTGFIYEGPSLIKRINKAILKSIELNKKNL
jgi:dihydroorotate dehydrogenase